MRARNAVAMSVAALAVTAAFGIVSAPLPSERQAGTTGRGGVIVVTVSGPVAAGSGSSILDCPALADLFSDAS